MKTICDCANALADIERDLETFEEHLEGTYVRVHVLTCVCAYKRTHRLYCFCDLFHNFYSNVFLVLFKVHYC
jgi:hypothetical protein